MFTKRISALPPRGIILRVGEKFLSRDMLMMRERERETETDGQRQRESKHLHIIPVVLSYDIVQKQIFSWSQNLKFLSLLMGI